MEEYRELITSEIQKGEYPQNDSDKLAIVMMSEYLIAYKNGELNIQYFNWR